MDRVACNDLAAIHAACEDEPAAATTDLVHDRADAQRRRPGSTFRGQCLSGFPGRCLSS
jgi:hypothetical protein